MPYANQILIQTKLHRPRLPKDLVTRTRLVELLNNSIDRPLILVCAPAGFGKTTLVSNWLRLMGDDQAAALASLPAAWLSLDENDSDLNLFLRYFIAALRTIFSEACESTLTLLQAQQQAPEEILYAKFINELEELPGEVILVLDDYQTIRGADVHNLLGELVRHMPSPLHLVLVSRLSPPIPLSNLRAKGNLSEIRTRDLRFTSEETAAYLRQSQIAPMSQKALPLLEERFEGWPAGLHLAALSLRSAGSQDAVMSALSSENANITEYLVDEVLTHQFPAIRSFLLKTSILDRFCASLCEAVIGEIDPGWNAGACLEWIERSELFLIPLDDRREWYRYHHLFQESLQQRLSVEMGADKVNNLRIRASAWFEEHGLLDEALRLAHAAGNLDLAARQMYAGLRDVLNHADRPTLERWLNLLPEEVIQQRPELLMIRIWTLHFLWQLDQLPPLFQQVEALLDAEVGASLPVDDLRVLRAQIYALRAQQAFFSNQTTWAIDLCREALTLIPPSWTFVRGAMMLYLGMCMQSNGQALAAERLILNEYESHGDKNDVFALRLLNTLGFIYLNTGQLEQARQIARVLLQGATHNKLAILKNWGDYFPGVVHYQHNELEAAAQHFTQIVENRFTVILTAYRDAVAGLALIHQIKGESAEAWRMVESISQFDLELRGKEDIRTHSIRARLHLMQGDLESAGAWVDSIVDPPPDMALLWLEEPQVTRARILVARGTPTDLQLALQVLGVLYEIAERTHNTRYKIEILALHALALDALASRALGQDSRVETSAGDAELKQALDLARPGGFIRVFVDLGKPMQAMLLRLEKQGHSAQMIRSILAAFQEDEKYIVSNASMAQPSRHPSLARSSLAGTLTPRELEVLSELSGPMSIKGIALKLNISHATAKRHTINLYGKLGVNKRQEAVAKAEELKILPPR
jgi:LuxR family maltose regulon positive regulatory protein